MSQYEQGAAMTAEQGDEVEAVVRWFNNVKGFGFVAVDNGGDDAFIHISTVARAGVQGLCENTRLRCVVAPAQRGMQVTHIIEVLGVDDQAPPPAAGGNAGGAPRGRAPAAAVPAPEGELDDVAGTVKWYKTEKGFGFVVPEDGGRDVFLHHSVLANAGLNEIEPGCRIQMNVQSSTKGREATAVQVID